MQNLISDILVTTKLKSAVYFKYGLNSPWGMAIPKGPFAQFHLVTGGQCVLTIDQVKTNLEKGDIVIFPDGHPHKIMDHKAKNCRSGLHVVKEITSGKQPFEGTHISTQLICGHYELNRELSHPILEQLPKYLILHQEDYGRYDLIHNIFELIVEEMNQQNSGHEFISLRLAEILFVSVIRHHYTKSKNQNNTNFFKDRKMYKIVDTIHKRLSDHLDLQTLSKEAGLSRTSFITRFKQATGVPPLKYIKNWRLTKAKYLLIETDLTLGEVGAQIGYQSEVSFNRVFKQAHHISPGKYRAKILGTKN